MSRRLKLQFNFDNDYSLIGIYSHLRDYRLIWFMNNEFKIDFKKYDDLTIFNVKQNQKFYFSFFAYNDIENVKSYFLLSNNNSNVSLIPEHKHFNYFIILNGDIFANEKKSLIAKIKNIPNILTVNELDINNIKNIDYLFEDIELHLNEIERRNKEFNKFLMNIIKK